jgi:zinc/manganese transport system permease protein
MIQPSWDLLADLQVLLSYPFMRNALLAGTIVAVVAGVIGYFMVLRGESFAGHTLANVGFAGAAGAVWLGLPPIIGLTAFGALASVGIGALGRGERRSSWSQGVGVGAVLTLGLGLGVLFSYLSTAKAANVYAILFGSALGVRDQDVLTIGALALVTLLAMAILARPLLFASVDPDMAAAHGVPVRLLTYGFLALLALAAALAVQVVGVLLIFALLVAPSATALQLTARPALGVALAVLIALLITWSGLVVAFYTPYPVGFFITTFALACYLLARLWRAIARRWASLRIGSSAPGPDAPREALG